MARKKHSPVISQDYATGQHYPGKISAYTLLIAGICIFLSLNICNNAYAEDALVASNLGTGKAAPLNFTQSEKNWIKQHPSFTIAFDENYPPYSYKNEQGEFVGIAVDIVHKLANKAGLKLKIYPNGQWKNLYSAAQAEDIDVIATLVKQMGREDWFEFTRPYLSLSQYIITREDNLPHTNTTDLLANKKVALIEGYSITELVLNDVPSIKPFYVNSLSEALEAVSTGLAEATIGDISMSNHLITRSGLPGLRFASLYTRVLAKQRFGVRKDWPELANILDKTLESLSYQELMEIYAHWRVPEIVRPEAGFISVQSELNLEEKQWLKAHPVIRLASDFAWPPFESIDENGRYSGIAADYMDLIEKRLGVKFIHSPRQSWGDIVDKLKNRELDVFSSAMETESRKAYATFTTPYVSYPMVIVSRQNVGYIDGLKGLSGKSIAIVKDYASYDLLKQNHPELNYIPHNDSASALHAVSRGKAFAYIGNIASISYVLREQGLVNLNISGQIPYQYALAMGVRSDWQTFVPILQKALDSISLEDKNAILKKWIGIEIEEKFDYEIVGYIAVIVTAILILLAYWNYSLKRLVNIRTSELDFQANYDNLTHLPNRFLSLNRLSGLITEAKENESNVAVLLLDIDDFKKINDALGHNNGDILLKSVANRLDTTLSQYDILGRLGGDEFLLCQGKLQTSQEAVMIVNRIFDCFSRPFNINDRELKLSVSLGISTYPVDGLDITELLRSADAAMYNAKDLGKNTFSFFNKSMKEDVARKLLLEECMHGSLERGEFEVHYQPKIEISTRKIMGFEALLRWNNEKLGSVSPVEFISIAENNGLIIPLGKYVIEQSLNNLFNLQSAHDVDLKIAINLSPVQFRDENFVDFVSQTLKSTCIPGNNIEFEITEGVLLSGYKDIKDTLLELKKLGICIAMDDFGTGYSSLSYIRNYPFDVLKIDQEFIHDISTDASDRELANATICMANNLGLKVVAEGVETEDQLEILKRFNCDYAQGFLIGKAAPAIEASKYFKCN